MSGGLNHLRIVFLLAVASGVDDDRAVKGVSRIGDNGFDGTCDGGVVKFCCVKSYRYFSEGLAGTSALKSIS